MNHLHVKEDNINEEWNRPVWHSFHHQAVQFRVQQFHRISCCSSSQWSNQPQDQLLLLCPANTKCTHLIPVSRLVDVNASIHHINIRQTDLWSDWVLRSEFIGRYVHARLQVICVQQLKFLMPLWMRVPEHIQYTLCVPTYRCLNGTVSVSTSPASS